MARIKIAQDQQSLFDYKPVKEDRVAIAKRNIEIQRAKKTPTVYIIYYRNGVECSHGTVEESHLEKSKQFYKNHFKDYEVSFEVFQPAEYWQKFYNGDFVVGVST